MAEVFLARRRAAGVEKWLVVKRIRAERATDVQFLDLFVREAKLSMSLAHQNIVPVFDFGRIDDQVFLAMERVEGRDLGSTLAHAKTAVSPLVAAFIAAECCQALDYAHRRKSPEGTPLGIVHRDVTPRNVLLSWSGEVKLTDFGIAALAGDATNTLLGTPAYMAPEQARKEPLDARTDVYAVGLVLREMLAGERARPGTDREALVAAARTGELRPWPAHTLSPELVAIVDRATSPDPAHRHADARELLAELDEFLVGERAANKADAPARQLAAWLDKVWGEERADEAAASGEIVADHMVSFLDDGALDVLGTGTQRSMLATAADEAGSEAVADAAAEAPVDKPVGPPGEPPVEPPGDRPADEPVPVAAPPATARGRWIALGLLAVVALGGGVYLATRSSVASTTGSDAAMLATDAAQPATDAAIATVDATPLATVDAALPVAVDAAIATIDAALPAPRDAALPVARDAALPAPRDAAARDAAELARDAAPVVALRKVTIQATPWAYVTVDGDPTRHETPATIQLAPGPHVLHFDNPDLQITRDVRIEVSPNNDMQHVEHLQ